LASSSLPANRKEHVMTAKILIIDHQELFRIFLGEIVKGLGHHVVYAESSMDGINTVGTEKIDLVILNGEMPEINGYETCQLIQRLDPNLTIIFYSSIKTTESLSAAFERGAKDYLCKPIIPTELKARLNIWLTQLESRQHLENQINLFKKFVPEVFLGAHEGLSLHFDQTFDVAYKKEEQLSTMFMDIRNFSAFSENISSKECFNFLSNYFTQLEPIVSSFKGSVYQYIGDGILSIFPLTNQGHSDNSLHSAVSMVDTVKIYNRGRLRAGYAPIHVGVGLNTGPVSLGIAGTKNRMSSGAFGPTVNLATRCENLSKKYQADIIVTEQTVAQLANPDAFMFRYLGKEQVQGFKAPVGIYEVYNSNTPESREEKFRNRELIRHIVDEIQKNHSSMVKDLLDDLIEKSSYDPLPLRLKEIYFPQNLHLPNSQN
jgi:class 3 adenylate cyclase/CheY-like chemotaxis protein